MDKLQVLTDQPDPIGNADGETCNRVHEPDEDSPRGYRTKPCTGVMFDVIGTIVAIGAWVECDSCGEIGD